MQKIKEIVKIHSIYFQFGYIEKGITDDGSQSFGRCPFCGDESHFFIRISENSSAWSCKKCQRSGGYRQFVNRMAEYCTKVFSPANSEALCKSRSIRFETFKAAGLGYHAVLKQFIIPAYNSQTEIESMKVYQIGKHPIGVAGLPLSMYCPHQLNTLQNAKTIYICEGEWDTLVMCEVIRLQKITDSYAIGVPGAGTFKSDIIPAISGKNVVLLYDNDDAGIAGKEKAIKLLCNCTESLKSIEWAQGLDVGTDTRDLYKACKCNSKDFMDALAEMVHPVQISPGSTGIADVKPTGKPPQPKEVYNVFQKWLFLPKTEILDVIFGTVLSSKLAGDPLWMFIVAPPGGTKTEPLLSMSNGSMIETVSTVTAHTLISGAPMAGGADPSLIPRLNEKVLIIKDFTSILGLPPLTRDEIFTTFRDCYDGECKKPFGNGIVRTYKSRFTILAAVTPAIESFTEDHASLGERFLRWNHQLPDAMSKRAVYIRKALGNVTHEKEMREELGTIAMKVLNADYGIIAPEVPEEVREKVIALSQITGMLRATVHRDKYSKQIEHNSFYELSTRLSKQLYKLIFGVTMFRLKKIVTNDEYMVAVHSARASITRRLYSAIQFLYDTKICTASSLSEKTGLPSSTATTILENLKMVGAVEKFKEAGSTAPNWRLTEEMLLQIEQSNFCKKELKHARKINK